MYEIGRRFPIGITLKSDEERLRFIRFPYKPKEITATAIIFLAGVIAAYLILSMFSSLLALTVTYLGIIFAVVLYIYPSHIFYSQEIMNYNEQLLKSILSMSNFISMNSSIEYAFLETTKQIRGLLKKEFEEIGQKLQRKVKASLADIFEEYIPAWNSINPVFVKSLRLLQTAGMAHDQDREIILKETIETLMLNFTTLGKRSAEELSEKAKGLISFGVLLPVTSLMLLPLLSVFLSDLIKPGMMIFMYNVLFPTVLLLMALDFANKRIQVDTITLEEAKEFKKMPMWIYLVCLALIVFFAIPGLNHLMTIDMSTVASAEKEYQTIAVFSVWLMTLGIVAAIYIFTSYYIWMHKGLWNDVKETEDDLPHMLQIFSTMLSLGVTIENILPGIAKDYKEEGFSRHPVVRIFTVITRKIMTSKENMEGLIRHTLSAICPSIKFQNILNQIVSFAKISQESAVKVTKLIREQVIAIYKLDDYMKTMLAETVGLINITITMLMPLLCAVAVIMSLVIVKSLNYITAQLASIQTAFGGADISTLQLVDITKIIAPTFLEIIVGIYFIEMLLVLSLFATKIKIGNDKFQLAKTINSNIMGYLIFSAILLAGHFLMSEVFFKGIMGE
jgi:hypothetical protein